MKNNNIYLPLFFLCWAFLYSSLAVWNIWSAGVGGQELAIEKMAMAGQVSRNSMVERSGPHDFTCFCCIDGNVSLVVNSEIDFISPSLQNPIKNIIKGPE